MTDAQRQLYQALKMLRSDLEIERGGALDYDLDDRIEATLRVLEWLEQALEQPRASTLHQDVISLPRAPGRAGQGKISGQSREPKLKQRASMRGQGRSGPKYPRNTFASVVAQRSPKDGYGVPSFYQIVLARTPARRFS